MAVRRCPDCGTAMEWDGELWYCDDCLEAYADADLEPVPDDDDTRPITIAPVRLCSRGDSL